MRLVCIGGEKVSPERVAAWHRRAGSQVPLLSSYGPTETTVVSTLFPTGDESATPLREVPLGRPISNVRVYCLDIGGQPCPIGVPGELCIAGAGLARGYFHRPEMTAEKFVPDPFGDLEGRGGGTRLYRTGDLARWRPDGELEFLGRRDFQVKIHGFRVELGEIETVLGQHPGVQQVAVLAREDRPGDLRLVAYVVATAGAVGAAGAVAAEALRGFLAARLPAYLLPSAFVFLEVLPLTPNGKLDRRSLSAPQQGGDEGAVPPRTHLELELTDLWEELLGVRSIGVRDNFFALGGHSLLAIRLMARIEGRFGRTLPLAELFRGGTIEDLAAALAPGLAARPYSPLVPLRAAGVLPALFLVHPVGGGVLAYQELTRRLEPKRPVYGLQARGLEAGEEPLTSIEEMARLYLASVRAVQAEGPYHLAGWSLGGLVAFEMARQFQQQKRAVGRLILIDAFAPGDTAPAAAAGDSLALVAHFARDLWGISGSDLTLPEEDLSGASEDELLGLLGERGRAARVLPPEIGIETLRRSFALFTTNLRAAERYGAGIYPGGAVIIRAADEPSGRGTDPALGWRERIAGKIELFASPGDHYTMVRRPHAEDLARRLDGVLEAPRKSFKRRL